MIKKSFRTDRVLLSSYIFSVWLVTKKNKAFESETLHVFLSVNISYIKYQVQTGWVQVVIQSSTSNTELWKTKSSD